MKDPFFCVPRRTIYDIAQQKGMEFVGSCVDLSRGRIEQLMKNAKRANKKKIDSLVFNQYPDMYQNLALNFYNPYNYYKTKTHLILVHSSVEYFFKVNQHG